MKLIYKIFKINFLLNIKKIKIKKKINNILFSNKIN